MRTLPNIGNSHLEQMNLIYEFICHFDVNNLLFAINGKQLDEDQIISLTNDINEYHVKLKRQKQNLFKFCKTFPKEFASEDNRLVDSSVKVSWRMRSGAAGIKKLFKKFCRVSRKKLPEGILEHQAHEVSLISTQNYILDLYGLSSYPQCVKDLFRVMYDFYVDLSDCLQEGLRTIKEVEITRGDAKKCLKILIDSCEKSKKNQQVLIEAMMTDPEMKKAIMNNKTFSDEDGNPVLKEYKKTTTSKELFAQKYYKNCSPKDVDKISIYEVATVDEDPNLCFAKVIFGNNENKIHRINYIIEHFDDLLPGQCKRNKIHAMNLYFFYQWCEPIVGYESFLKYFNKYYKEHGGKWGLIGKSALAGACTKNTQCKDGSTQNTKEKMLSKIESMFNKKSTELEIAS